ncbi:hypothetical protein GCM10022217_28690 [Chryseobacterium ginsenosidimutans]|uniref:DUF6705 family protein n=1 Tax=Chryseobacterium ginsenosidimutans TaxID=687846 RepID=UPI0031CE441B
MKNTIFKTLFLISLINNFLSCKAQQIMPLNTSIDDIPANAYVKDLNHELDPYIGTYKADHQGKEITLFITKVENKLEKNVGKIYYLDALIVKYIIKNSSGTILQDTQNMNLQNNGISSYRIRSYDNSVILYYEGTNCGVGWGNVFLKKINATQISWLYEPDDLMILPGQCPGNPDLIIYLPETKDPLIFTKQ